jgi:hypothetical protein
MTLDEYHIIAVLLTMTIVVVAVFVHYEGLRVFTVWLKRTTIRPRLRIVLLIYGLLLLHAAEIWIFGAGYWWLARDPGFGSLVGQTELNQIVDYVYFSATVYSTLGFGDLIPQGPTRFLAGIESVTGLLMITWSASFTYLEMIRYWREEN